MTPEYALLSLPEASNAYGTKIYSDIPLPLDQSLLESAGPPLYLRRAASGLRGDTTDHWIEILNSQGRKVFILKENGFTSFAAGELWVIEVKNTASFRWRHGDRTIHYTLSQLSDNDRFVYWLVHMVLPLFKRIEEDRMILHTAALDFEGQAVLFAAPSQGGKSTLARRLNELGRPFMADDKIAVTRRNGQVLASGSYPCCRHYRCQEDLGTAVIGFQARELPVGAMYLLESRHPESDISIERIRGNEAFMAMSMAQDVPLSFLRKRDFTTIAALAQEVPLYRLGVPWSREKLGEVASSIGRHRQVSGDRN